MPVDYKLYDQLMEIGHNLWWSWQADVAGIFRDLDVDRWREVNHNPVAFLKRLSPERLNERAQTAAIESRVIYAYHRLQEYMQPQRGWGATHAGPLKVRPVGYFSAEFGLHESLPIYSGGLGVLAGDHLKSASDLGVPLVGVGLFYDQGYFRQHIDADGMQQETYGRAQLDMLPLRRALDADGHPLTVQVETLDGTLYASVLKVQVGRSLLILLDPSIEQNVPDDQLLTVNLERLYGGGQRARIRQELLLGVGGLRALRALGIDPGPLHLNEGHSAFATIEAARQTMIEQGMDFEQALRELQLVILDQRVADFPALRLVERVRHRAADYQGVDLVDEVLDHADLVGDLRAAEYGDEGPGGIREHLVEGLDLFLKQEARDGRLEVFCHALRRGVRAVRRTECVVHVEVAERRELLGEGGVVLLLLLVEARVLQEKHVAVRELAAELLDLLADAVGRHLHGAPEELPQPLGRGREAELGLLLALRPAEVAHEDDLRAGVHEMPYRRQRGPDSRVVLDFAFRDRHVEVDAHQGPLAFDVAKVADGHLRHGCPPLVGIAASRLVRACEDVFCEAPRCCQDRRTSAGRTTDTTETQRHGDIGRMKQEG